MIPEVYEGAGRGASGHFATGNKVARGNPQNKHMAQLRKAAREAATPEQVREVIDHFRELFLKQNDVIAGRVWLEHVVGKPTQAIEVSGPDAGPARVDLGMIAGLILQVAGDDEDRRALAVRLVKQLRPPVEDGTDGPGA
jgi:hypothetical protein